MPENERPWRDLVQRYFTPLVLGTPALAFIPAFCLAAFWFGGEGALMVMAATLPIVYLAAAHLYNHGQMHYAPHKGILPRKTFVGKVQTIFTKATQQGLQSAIFMVEIEEYEDPTNYRVAKGFKVKVQFNARLRNELWIHTDILLEDVEGVFFFEYE